jgi:hypothetical protein
MVINIGWSITAPMNTNCFFRQTAHLWALSPDFDPNHRFGPESLTIARPRAATKVE